MSTDSHRLRREHRRARVQHPAPPQQPAAATTGAAARPVRSLVCLLLLIALGAVAYSRLYTAGFIWDDESYVLENPHLPDPHGLARIWALNGESPQYYPMVFTTFWIEYHLWGLNPIGYHVVNVVLHICNAVLIWQLLRRVGFRFPYVAALVFALHPVHVETVAWVTERKNVLSTLFYLLSWHA